MFVEFEAEVVSAEISKNIENIEVEDNTMILIEFMNLLMLAGLNKIHNGRSNRMVIGNHLI